MALAVRPQLLPSEWEPFLTQYTPDWKVNTVLSMNDYVVLDIEL